MHILFLSDNFPPEVNAITTAASSTDASGGGHTGGTHAWRTGSPLLMRP
jgi:hypothetical protein